MNRSNLRKLAALTIVFALGAIAISVIVMKQRPPFFDPPPGVAVIDESAMPKPKTRVIPLGLVEVDDSGRLLRVEGPNRILVHRPDGKTETHRVYDGESWVAAAGGWAIGKVDP